MAATGACAPATDKRSTPAVCRNCGTALVYAGPSRAAKKIVLRRRCSDGPATPRHSRTPRQRPEMAGAGVSKLREYRAFADGAPLIVAGDSANKLRTRSQLDRRAYA